MTYLRVLPLVISLLLNCRSEKETENLKSNRWNFIWTHEPVNISAIVNLNGLITSGGYVTVSPLGSTTWIDTCTRTRILLMSKRNMNKLQHATNGNVQGRNVLTLSHWNLGSRQFQNKVEEIEILTGELQPDLLYISKANLMKNTPEYSYQIEGYDVILPRTMDRMGYARILLLVKQGIDIEVLENCMETDISAIWVKISNKGRKPLISGGIYREQHLLLQGTPNLSDGPNEQLDRWNRTLRGWRKAARNQRCTVLGDFNLDFFKWGDPVNHHRLVDLTKLEVETLGYSQIINGYTRTWPGQDDSLVDHCWTNDLERVVCHSNSIRAESDHNMITVNMRIKDKIMIRQEIWMRNRKKFDLDRIKLKSSQLDWSKFYETDDVNIMNHIMETNILSVLDSEAPLRKLQQRKNHCEWIDDSLKKKIKDRDNCRERARISGNRDKWENYRRMRNDCTKEIRKTKNEHFQRKFKNLAEENNSKKIHSEIYDLLGKKRDLGPRTFFSNGRFIRKPKELANEQLNFYERKMNKIMLKMRTMTGNFQDPIRRLEQALERWEGRHLISEFKFKEINALETSRMVAKLGNTTSHGHDKIDAMFVKLILPAILNPLTHLINSSLREKVFANKWRISVIHPLLKGNDLDRMNPESYRPVCSLSTISKLVERTVQIQMLNYLEQTRQLNMSAHTYRRGLSTTTTLSEICDSLYSAAEHREISSVMTMDQTSAFNCINHDILLKKMKTYNMDQNVIDWTENYLKYRTEMVMVGGAESRMLPVLRGVPQGSVLGPLLYAIYVNEITLVARDPNCQDAMHLDNSTLFGKQCSKCGSITVYADDSTYCISSKSRERNQENISRILDGMNVFLRENELVLNQSKTTIVECMLSQRRIRNPGPPPRLLVTDDQGNMKDIIDIGRVRILGMNLSANLTWISHLETGPKALLPAVRRQLGALQHLRKFIPSGCRKLLANTLLMSKLIYLMPVWGGATPNHISKVQIVQNKIARWVTGMRRKTRINELLQACDWMSIHNMIRFHSTLMIWKMIQTDKPGHLSAKLNIRDDNLINITEPRLQFTGRSLINRGAVTWNDLPADIRSIVNCGAFKRRLKKWIREEETREPD